MRTIGIVLYPDVMMLDVAGPLDVFIVANRYLPKNEQYDIYTIAADKKPFYVSNGVKVIADFSIEDSHRSFYMLMIPGGPGAHLRTHPELVPWLKATSENSEVCASVCTGAFILAETGILDGYRVTTHWEYIEKFSKRFPDVNVERNKVIVRDRNILTCGGVTAGIDLALSVIAENHGRQIATDIAKVLLVVTKRKGGQVQFSPILAEVSEYESSIGKVESYIIENINKPLKIEMLAVVANMSVRSFTRQFKNETGLSPIEYVQRCRVDKARQLLESTKIPIKSVAFNCGLSDAHHLRNLFIKYFSTSPSAYRSQFE